MKQTNSLILNGLGHGTKVDPDEKPGPHHEGHGLNVRACSRPRLSIKSPKRVNSTIDAIQKNDLSFCSRCG